MMSFDLKFEAAGCERSTLIIKYLPVVTLIEAQSIQCPSLTTRSSKPAARSYFNYRLAVFCF
jgi:hypothetical protein